MRPRNETDGDRQRELEIAEELVKAWGLHHALKLGEVSYVIDFALVDELDAVRCFAECKCRDWTFGNGDGFYLGLFKAMRGRALGAASGLPSIVAVRFLDGMVRWASMADYKPDRCFEWGRSDRGQNGDIEPSVVFPWSAFSRP